MRETGGQSPTATAAEPPSLDLIFDLLSNQRRRYVLYSLNEQPENVATVSELVDVVLNHERRTEDLVADAAEGRDRVRVDLQHVQLPKLEAAGIVEHDQRSETVRYWGQPSLEEWLEHAQYKELS